MAYIENPFKAGQEVVCIKDSFPCLVTTGDKSQIGSMPDRHPVKGEHLVIDEILGEYLRFEKYDEPDQSRIDYGWHWWKHTQFAAVQDDDEQETEEDRIIYAKIRRYLVDAGYLFPTTDAEIERALKEFESIGPIDTPDIKIS